MTTYQTVTAGTTITASWGNNVRDGLVTGFASASARSSQVPSPPSEFTTFLRDAKRFEVFDGSNYVPVQSLYKGENGRTANVTATTTETLCDSVTVTALAGRIHRFTWSGSGQSSAGGDNWEVRVRWAAGTSVTSSGTQAHGVAITGSTASVNVPISFSRFIGGLPAGQVTIGVFVIRTFGAGTITATASATNPASLMIEDIGS